MEEKNIDTGRGFGDDEILRLLKKDAEKIPLLTSEEEIDIARRVQAGDQAAADLLINSNIRLVIYVAQKHWYPGLPLMDMISEGCMRIMNAAKLFDPAIGVRFSSYAYPAIKHGVWRVLRDYHDNRHRSLDEPVQDGEDGNETTLKDLLSSDDAMVAWAQNMTDKKKPETEFPECPVCHRQVDQDARTCPHCKVCFQRPHNGENPVSVNRKRGHTTGKNDADKLTANKQVHRSLSVLDNREYRIIVLRFWLDLTREEVSKKIGCSATRVMQIENGALRKMRWAFTGCFSTDQRKATEPVFMAECQA